MDKPSKSPLLDALTALSPEELDRHLVFIDVPKVAVVSTCTHYEPPHASGGGHGLIAGRWVNEKCAMFSPYAPRCNERCPREDPRKNLERRLKRLDEDEKALKTEHDENIAAIHEQREQSRRYLTLVLERDGG